MKKRVCIAASCIIVLAAGIYVALSQADASKFEQMDANLTSEMTR